MVLWAPDTRSRTFNEFVCARIAQKNMKYMKIENKTAKKHTATRQISNTHVKLKISCTNHTFCCFAFTNDGFSQNNCIYKVKKLYAEKDP